MMDLFVRAILGVCLTAACVFLTRLAMRVSAWKPFVRAASIGAWAIMSFLAVLLMSGPARWLERPDDGPYFPNATPFAFDLLCRLCDYALNIIVFPGRCLVLLGMFNGVFSFVVVILSFLFWGVVGHTIVSAMCRWSSTRGIRNAVGLVRP
jgi:hypothetical protein